MQRVATLLATESTTPAAISSRFAPFPIKLITSDSAKTVHKELIFTVSPFFAISNNSSIVTPSLFAITSINFPVPAEHLSFIIKSLTKLFSTIITFVSCPPISIIVQSPFAISVPPFPWQVISVIILSAKSTEILPYPVATTFVLSSHTSIS